jgi:hypothetical protein
MWCLGRDHDFEQRQRQWLLQGYPEYFLRLWERASFGQHVVGNSDHVMLPWLPALWPAWPDMRFLFSTRNAINCVESQFVHRAHLDATALARFATLHQTQDFFEQCCHEWKREVDAMLDGKRFLMWMKRPENGRLNVNTILTSQEIWDRWSREQTGCFSADLRRHAKASRLRNPVLAAMCLNERAPAATGRSRPRHGRARP